MASLTDTRRHAAATTGIGLASVQLFWALEIPFEAFASLIFLGAAVTGVCAVALIRAAPFEIQLLLSLTCILQALACLLALSVGLPGQNAHHGEPLVWALLGLSVATLTALLLRPRADPAEKSSSSNYAQ